MIIFRSHREINGRSIRLYHLPTSQSLYLPFSPTREESLIFNSIPAKNLFSSVQVRLQFKSDSRPQTGIQKTLCKCHQLAVILLFSYDRSKESLSSMLLYDHLMNFKLRSARHAANTYQPERDPDAQEKLKHYILSTRF